MPASAAIHLMESAWANYAEPPLWVDGILSAFKNAFGPSEENRAKPEKREIPQEVLTAIRARQEWKNGGKKDADLSQDG
jgi:hypothetical protein